jgi:capsular polysaccharide biosynthesis protein
MEEMSTREIIETIIKGRTTILGLTAICIVIGLIVNLFILEPVYEAETTLMISPISQTNANAKAINEFSSLVNAIAAYPEMSIGTYREQIKAPAILQYIKEEMNLKDLSLKSISDKITVEAIKNTNLITVKVRDKNAEVAAQIANILSERYTRFVSDTNKKQAEGSAEIIETQMQKEKENLENASEKIKNFISKPRSPEELKLELESKLTQVTEFKTSLAQTKVDEENTRRSIKKAKSLLSQTPKTLTTNSTFYGEDLLPDIVGYGAGLNLSTRSDIKLSNEEVNLIYVELSNSLNQLEIQLANLEASRENME